MKRHVSPTDSMRQSRAPYNFVPLPEEPLTRSGNVPSFEAWDVTLHSGVIDLSIETLTPLYIRDKKRAIDTGASADSRLRARPFLAPDGRTPAIPASSLRGMLRSLVEILSFSRISNVSSDRPFYRALSTDGVSLLYRAAMAAATPPRGGILGKDHAGWFIAEGTVARVSHGTIRAAFKGFVYETSPNYHPQRDLQRRQVWAKLDDGSCVELQDRIGDAPDGFLSAILVLTGSAGPLKTKEFVLVPVANAQRIEVPETILRRACDDDQVTGWQEKEFPRDATRPKAGAFAEGDAVFFGFFDSLRDAATNPAGLFFGRAGMFRLPYDLSPRDLLPAEQKSRVPHDLSTALFGRVDEKGGTGEAFASRVRFRDAKAVGNRTDWLESLLVPRILASPKPTAFAHYLVQDGRLQARQLRTYVRGDQAETTIRGHKVYWHRWDSQEGLRTITWVDPKPGSVVTYRQKLDQMTAIPNGHRPLHADTQCTVMTPVKAGVRFEGQIRFENLRPEELGALLAALRLPDGCAHRLGMGKPLGLGSVRIVSKVRFLDAKARYSTWGDSGYAEAVEKEKSFAKAFEKLILDHADATGEPKAPDAQDGGGLARIARLGSLFTLLSWEMRPPHLGETSYPTLDEYKVKKVLPTPAGVVGDKELAATNAPAPADRNPAPTSKGQGQQNASAHPVTAPKLAAGGASKRGDRVDVVVLPCAQWLKKGTRPTVEVVGGRMSGPLKDPLPVGIQPGQRLKVTIVEPSATKMQSQFQVKEP